MKVVPVLLIALGAAGQQKAPAPADPKPIAESAPVSDESTELSRELAEGGNSPHDFIRVLEAHLAKYPDSTRKADIERALLKSALEAKDDARLIEYGERLLARDPSDVQLLDRVARAYLTRDDPPGVRKGLDWARKEEQVVENLRKESPRGRLSVPQWSEELDKARARALVLESRANGSLGQKPVALQLAKKSFDSYPTAEGAREWAKWLAETGDTPGAIERLADAFTIEDPRSTDADRARDRRRMGELFTKANGSEKGLGDFVLRAYDRTSSLIADRAARLKSLDPNVQAGTILDFTLPGANGKDLTLKTLQGKTVVLDFWATWCGPCKVQRPLYQEVEKRFKDRSDVVFLSVNTDDDRSLVLPYIKSQNWSNLVYYDGGLSDYARVNSIPTTMIVDKNGQIASRMNGFIPERFVDLLTERIQETLR